MPPNCVNADSGRKNLSGSCHCGRIKFGLAGVPKDAIRCNCSICRRKGYLLAFTSSDAFRLRTPRDNITAYTFGKHAIRHQFCKKCGCAPFGEGTGPDGSGVVFVNLNCVDDFDVSSCRVTEVDGASL